MKMSETITELATALAKAQGAMEDATKSETNPHFRSKYADLAAVREVIRAPLAANDLSVIQAARTREHEVEVETMLLHKSGEYIAETLSLPVTKRDAQGVGSAISYARRYGLMSLLGLAAADDDGNAAVANPPARTDKRASLSETISAPLTPTGSSELLAIMQDALAMCDSPDSVKAWAKANSAAKSRLLPEHQEIISAMYRDRLADVSQPVAAE
jgi:hypothetical protein